MVLGESMAGTNPSSKSINGKVFGVEYKQSDTGISLYIVPVGM